MSKDYRFNKKEHVFDDDIDFDRRDGDKRSAANKKRFVKLKQKSSFKRVDKRSTNFAA